MKLIAGLTLLILTFTNVCAAEPTYSKFFGHFTGAVEISSDQIRNLEVEIQPTQKGFSVNWKTITLNLTGNGKSKSYSIDFIESQRPGIFGSAMKTNIFGGQEALDPMKGEPYFWAKINNDTLTIFGMLITENGNYEIQRYDRTLQDNDMKVVYTLSQEDQVKKTINAMLTRQ